MRAGLIAAAVLVSGAAPDARDRSSAARSWEAAQEARQAREAERRRAASFLRAYERRRAAAHARMPSTMRASTPDPAARGALSCPAAPGRAEDFRPSAPRVFFPSGSPAPRIAAPRRPFFVPAPARSGVGVRPARVAGSAATSPSSGGSALATHAMARAFAAGAASIRASAIGDFNGDGKDDAMLRHGDGRWRYYAMDGRTHIAAESGDADIEADPAWVFAGAGDFNGDGKDDVMLRHADGRWRYHAMDGRARIAGESGDAGLTTDAAWRVAGIGDFDGDGNDDVLLRHAADMRWHFYPMDGREILDGGGSANLTRKAEWSVAGVGDLDGDGSDDVLLRKDSGTWFYYPMDGRRHISGRHGAVGLTSKAEYAIAGVGDFDGDGKDDVMLRRDDGLWYFYPMNGREILDGRGGANLTRNREWSLAGIGDLDGDGKDDVLLRKKDTTGAWYFYPMESGRRHAAAGRGGANLTADRSWRPAGEAEPVFRDCPACPDMIRVPAGAFAMGSPASEPGRSEDEGPVREVTFAEPFAIGVNEVTFAQWEACVADGGCGGHTPSDWDWGGGGRPAMDVTWEQARSYAEWLAAKTGEEYRLPTEAEWEYAARAGTETPFHTGATISTERANYDGALPPYGDGEAGESRARTTAAGTFPANAFGLRDTHGNVAEWTLDCYAPSYRGAPAHGAAVESESCAGRVMRGGSWRDGPEELRSANRDYRAEGAYSNTLGFRVAKGAPPAGPTAETAAEAFEASVSPVVQSKCVNCHVEGGASGNTRLVFVRDTDANHLATNLSVFETFLAEVEGGAELILNKIQGVGHGGGIQVAAGTDEFEAMEKFLELLEGEEAGPVSITPGTLFDGVGMESWRSTLRRAAIIFAGRIPTEEEYASIRSGSGLDVRLRAAIRGLMEGPGFHEFLIRASNDRLLTDRDDIQGVGVIDPIHGYFVDYNNLNHEKLVAEDPGYGDWRDQVNFGIRRAPLELIAHVVENDLPYTEILAADYIMANPMAAEAYGAGTVFADPTDPHEFQRSEIASYYRDDDSKVTEYTMATGTRVIDPGNLLTDYPHAGILNTTVFLKRYPTTATNRNRARSRWTYYHFLGLDIEKSASRTTEPDALADTNNPTMNNPACTVCHTVMDPVAGTFQNYDDIGYYRSGPRGLDSLDEFYRLDAGDEKFEVRARSREERETITAKGEMAAGDNTIRLAFVNDHSDEEGDRNLYLDRLDIRNAAGEVVDSHELEAAEPTDDCNSPSNAAFTFWCSGWIDVTARVAAAGSHDIEIVAWADQYGGEPARLGVGVNTDPYQYGDTWYRDMRAPGFDGERVPDADYSLRWLTAKIVGDPRFAEATVKFWWPAIMGTDVAEPPSEGDPDFDGRLLASNAQAAEVARLTRGFRRGFRGGEPHNLKDLLTEIVLSKWFRADSIVSADPVRAAALADAGANRLLTPEELSRKTLALTGFGWGRRRPSYPWHGGLIERNDWTARHAYGLLYGGIDSGGIAERARNITAIMAGVAKLHAASVACPVVMKELYLAAEGERRLLDGVDLTVSPAYEFGATLDVDAESRETRREVSVTGLLRAGKATATVYLENELWDDEQQSHVRSLYLDRLVLRDSAGRTIKTQEFEEVDHECAWGAGEAIVFWNTCPVAVPLDVPTDGSYEVAVSAWAEQGGDEMAKLRIVIESDTEESVGARAVKATIADLHEKLLGDDASKTDMAATYDLFVELWRSTRGSLEVHFDMRCDYREDQYYFDGIVDGTWWVDPEEGEDWDWEHHGFDIERIDSVLDTVHWSDPHHVARTWAAVLAYLLTDYRYLYL